MSLLSRLAAVAAVGVAGGVIVVALGARAWDRATNQLVARLAAGLAGHAGDQAYDPREIEALPAPVARYFRFALTPGQRIIRTAHLRSTGTFASKPNVWSPFTASQRVSARPPGFVWDARIVMMPMVPVRVRDSYVAGEGAMRASAAGVVSMVDQHGTPAMASASLMRWLAEAVWFPTALLPRDGLSWAALDDSSARVTLTDRGTTVSLDVTFAPTGEITTVSGQRYRDVNGTPVATAWVGHHATYRRVDGMMIPTTGEVAWILSDGPAPYWRGTIVEAKFDW